MTTTSPTTTAYPPSHKFRPYFTAPELQEIIRCLKASSHSQELLRYMETFALQIERGTRSPALTTAPTIEQRLGVAPAPAYGIRPPVHSVHELYQIWLANPEFLAPPQLAELHQYRWESDLMGVEESARYEEKILEMSASTRAK